jgi:hypothetical protein
LWIKGEYYDAFPAVETVAKGGLDRDHQAAPFDRLDWLRQVAAHGPTGRPLIVRARSEGSDAWLFMHQPRPGRLEALANDHAHRFGPIFVGSADDLQRRRLLRAIGGRLRRPGLGIARITLPALDRDDAELVGRAFRRAGWVASLRALPPRYRARTPALGFDDYLEHRPERIRTLVESGGKGPPLDFEVADRFSPALWSELEALARGGADGFLRAVAEQESAAGGLRLGIARLDETAMAAQLWSVAGGTATAHVMVQAPRARDAAAGAQLTATMARYLLNVDQVALLDFGPCGRWIRDWADETVPRARLELLNPRAPVAWGGIFAAAASTLVRRGSLD